MGFLDRLSTFTLKRFPITLINDEWDRIYNIEMSEEYIKEYINVPTAHLVYNLEQLISRHPKLEASEEVRKAFEGFKRACKKPAAIVAYIDEHTDPDHPEKWMTKQQIELMWAATLFRSSSTYATIPHVVSELHRFNLHHEAHTINKNAVEEGGDKNDPSHAQLLYTSMWTLGKAMECHYLRPKSFDLARWMYLLHEEDKRTQAVREKGFSDPFKKSAGENDSYSDQPADFDRLKKKLQRNKDIPDFHPLEFESAAYFCNLGVPEMNKYYSKVMAVTQQKDDYGNPVKSEIRLSQPARLAVNVLELAAREANTTNQEGSLSYIGAYDKLARSYLGYIDHEVPFARDRNRDSAMKWSVIHNDEGTGHEHGWTQQSAEAGHAEDANRVALTIMAEYLTDDPEMFAATLREVTELSHARNDFWKSVVKRMDDLKGEPLPLKPVEYEPPHMRRKQSWISKFRSRPNNPDISRS